MIHSEDLKGTVHVTVTDMSTGSCGEELFLCESESRPVLLTLYKLNVQTLHSCS